MTVQQMVRDLHERMGLPYRDRFEALSMDEATLRDTLLCEEVEECQVELYEDDSGEKLAKEMADIVMVVYGTAVQVGIDLDKAVELVYCSNLTKAPFEKRSDGKVLKGPNYQPPDMRSAVL